MSAIPAREDRAAGLFAWGQPSLKRRPLQLAWSEFVFVFFALPLFAVVSGVVATIPVAIGFMLASTIALLSTTRNFHWSDLAPVDMLSEWRLALGFTLGAAGLSLVAALAFAPSRLFAFDIGLLPMLVAFPLVTAAPIELVQRALFFRRFGRLFQSSRMAVAVGAASNALVYIMLCGTVSGALFGAVLGLALGAVYLRTGQFLLCILLHWVAALCIFLIGPGLTAF